MNKYKKINDICEIIFKVIYAVHLILAFNVYTTQSKYTLPFVLLTAGIIGIYRIIKVKQYIKCKNLIILICFLLSYAITTIINIKYGWFENLQTFIWMTFQMGLLYTIDIEKGKKEICKEFKIVSLVILICVTIINTISIIMLFAQYSGVAVAIDGSAHIAGISKWGRLYGLYTDPNYAGILSIVTICISAYFIRNRSRILEKILYGITIIIQFIYITFSGSRSSLLSLIIGLCTYAICLIISSKSTEKKYKIINGGITAISIFIIIFASSKGMTKTYNYFISKINNDVSIQKEIDDASKEDNVEQESDMPIIENKEKLNTMQIEDEKNVKSTENKDSNKIEENTANKDKKNNSKLIEIGREEKINQDISNRRFDIWISAFELFLTKPIFGIGFENIIAYATENLPNTYMVNNDYIKFNASHNVIVDVIVSQGIVGFAILTWFAIASLKTFIKNIKVTMKNDRDIVSVLIAICSVLIVSSMFLSQVLYVNCITTCLFWIYLGYLIYFLEKNSGERE